MGISTHYSHPTTPAGPGFDVDLGETVRADAIGLATMATVGESAGSSVPVDDPDGDLDFQPLHRVYFVCDECPVGDQVIWNGYTADIEVSRGPYRQGAGRVWTVGLQDDNAILSFRTMGPEAGTHPHANRPAETAEQRLTWLLSVDHVGSVLIDHGLIDWTGLGGFDMDAQDYTASYTKDVLADISIISGYVFWAQYREASEDIQLACFDANTSDWYTSDIALSNVDEDVDWTTTFPCKPDGVYHREGGDIAAGVLVMGQGVTSYQTQDSTSYAYGFRDKVAPSASAVKTQATADFLAVRYLNQHDAADEWISVTAYLPAAYLTALKAGMRVSFRSSFMPGMD